ncbi:MAG TPA: hypothetical protein VFA07_17350 [Chthonomonadaceae bacterium]|nr:hypothetical protein [Chthonomonadaceae bacterium]
MNSYVKWFAPVVLIGVLINILGMALPFVFTPTWFLAFFSVPGGGGSIIWMRQAGILLFFISILYVPGGINPFRYRLNAQFAVAARMTIGLYWLWLVFLDGQPHSFLIFGALDCIYATIQWVLLWLIFKEEERYASPPDGAA